MSSISFPYTVHDKELIKWLKENRPKISYIQYKPEIDNYERSKDLRSDIDKLNENKPLHEQKKLLLKIWKNLIGNAIVYLKSNDGREEYHDDEDYGVDKLYDFFNAFCKFESLFYGANSYYRDHVSHVFKVFLLGEIVIKEKVGFGSINIGEGIIKDTKPSKDHQYAYPDVGKPEEENEVIVSEDEKEAMWCIASLTHDLGYGIGVIPELNKKAREMLHQFGNFNPRDLTYTFPSQPLYTYMIRFISSGLEKGQNNSFVNHIQSKYFLKFSGSLEKNNHGIISCIVLMRNLVYFLESDYTLDHNKPLTSDEARHFLIRRSILRSIASHDCEDIYYLKVCDFPFLLTLFDEMQEWGRPSLNDLFEKKPKMELTIREFSEKKVAFTITLKREEGLDASQVEKEHQNAIKYFKRKCEKIRRILRSAVDGKMRNFILHFKLEDHIEGSKQSYEIIHEKPNKVQYKIGSEDVSWRELLNRAADNK